MLARVREAPGRAHVLTRAPTLLPAQITEDLRMIMYRIAVLNLALVYNRGYDHACPFR
jgi:hypothetical protein